MSKQVQIILFTVAVVLLSIDATNGDFGVGMNPDYIGARVSVTTKNEIRYEGKLYAMDVMEATISLAQVRSFGTEDRPTDRPIPARDETFPFIVFRGTDIKNIEMLEPPQRQPEQPDESDDGMD